MQTWLPLQYKYPVSTNLLPCKDAEAVGDARSEILSKDRQFGWLLRIKVLGGCQRGKWSWYAKQSRKEHLFAV